MILLLSIYSLPWPRVYVNVGLLRTLRKKNPPFLSIISPDSRHPQFLLLHAPFDIDFFFARKTKVGLVANSRDMCDEVPTDDVGRLRS